jgi:hypothetical protein
MSAPEGAYVLSKTGRQPGLLLSGEWGGPRARPSSTPNVMARWPFGRAVDRRDVMPIQLSPLVTTASER